MNDVYNIRQDWERYKALTIELESDILSFFKKPTTRKWATLIRKKSKEMELIGLRMKKNILKDRQDSISDYS